MDFFETLKNRHCCRIFDADKNVDDDTLGKPVECGKIAPPAGGVYDQRFEIVRDLEKKKKTAHHYAYRLQKGILKSQDVAQACKNHFKLFT